ncbi:GNAT family N-acetyltransferase [Margalitia sp. FSL K6-0131]|uniref:GNAT family N-acetyltransferase n=1 Tax=Margalitia sp. FSL K6-0131 TaxID=2954604 RepID=UPI0030F9DD83
MHKKQYKDALRLSSYAFQYDYSERELEKKIKSYEDQDLYGIFDGDQLAAKLHIRPFHIWLEQQQVKMGGISSVATYPEYRRKGYVRELLIHSLSEMRRNGQTVSFLHPFSIPFYRKFGWEVFSEFLTLSLTKADLIRQPQQNGYIKRFSRDSNIEDLKTIYPQFADKFIGMMTRDRIWWKENVIQKSQVAIYYDQHHTPLGYMLYDISKKEMEIREFVPLNHEARIGLWNFICQHDSMVNKVEMYTYVSDPLPFTLFNPDIKTERKTFGMARIVDVKEFCKIYPFQWSDQSSVTFQIVDEHAPWNTGTYTLNKDMGLSFSPELRQNTGLSFTINHFTALLLGFKTAQQLSDAGAIKGSKSEMEALQSILLQKEPSLFDGF